MATQTVERKSKVKKRSQMSAIWFRFKKNKLALFGLVLLVLMCSVALFAPLIADYEQDVMVQNVRIRLQPPTPDHIFGTDQYGRDIFGRIIYGTRISLFVGLVTIGIALTAGGIIGAAAGYYGGKVDNFLMRCMDVLLAIPSIVMAIAIVTALGPGIFNLLIALSISRTPQFARIVRSAILSIRGQEFIEAARACGTSDARIILKHILPNVMGPIIVQSTLNMATTILAIASLSFVGLGVQPPTPEWGSMLSEAREFMRRYPYLVVSPGVSIMLSVLSLNLIGDGLRDALDPRLKN